MEYGHQNVSFEFIWVPCGFALFLIQWAIWTQINRRLPPAKQIGFDALKDTFIWFREGGLLAQHKSLYPESRLPTVFRVLWGIFWLAVVGWMLQRWSGPRPPMQGFP